MDYLVQQIALSPNPGGLVLCLMYFAGMGLLFVTFLILLVVNRPKPIGVVRRRHIRKATKYVLD
jgi:hypothetical protein